jgi:hypothetical protein
MIAQKDRQYKAPSYDENLKLYYSIVNKMHISPGRWRPLFNSEQICWISPPWASEEYIYLDFPEAIFFNDSLIYLSHVSNRFPAKFNYQLPDIEWKGSDSLLRFERNIKGYFSFGGEVRIYDTCTVTLQLWIKNQSSYTFSNILLQTCAYLYPIKEFSMKTNKNKYIHTKDNGWISLETVLEDKDQLTVNGKYRVGWRDGPEISDLPVIITSSENNEHFLAMTWYQNTFSFIGNPEHPCFHADPYFPDIMPGETKYIKGAIIFLHGTFQEISVQVEDIIKSK